MSSVAAIIKVADSLIPLPPEAFPKNLSRTVREDSPESMFPILAYDGQNILPTPWGYRSYFATNEKLLQDAAARLLPNVKCENIFWYQSVNLDNLLVALASDGIYITNTDIDTAWIKVVDLAAFDTDPLVRNQWTFCTINNYTYVYMQGIDAFYGFVDPARYAEAATPSIITGATVTQVATHWNVGVIKYIPTFLNMEGQIGIFKAGNRLGFWDSDSSVSWSSALYVEDMTPSVTTLAGFSKFTDVIGTITKIIQHGDGFIIYCTRSIVGCSNNTNEKSKFSGRSILSNTGVLFDRQIVAAQPDSLHYILTSSGLYTITNFNPEAIATDIIDGLVEYNDYLTLDYIDGRYLFINTINGWQGSVLDFAGETNSDFDGNEFTFPAVDYPNPEDAKALLESYLSGKAKAVQAMFKDYEPLDDPVHVVPEGKALIPCYDVRTFDSSWVDETYATNYAGSYTYVSNLALTVTQIEDFLAKPTILQPPVYDTNGGLFDKAEQELVDSVLEGLLLFKSHMDFQDAWQAAMIEPVQINTLWESSALPTSVTSIPVTDLVFETIDYFNHSMITNLKQTFNGCDNKFFIDRYTTARVKAIFNGTENWLGKICVAPIAEKNERTIVSGPSTGLFLCPGAVRSYIVAPVTPDFWNEFYALRTQLPEGQQGTYFGTELDLYADDRFESYKKFIYTLWLALWNPELVQIFLPNGSLLDEATSKKSEVLALISQWGGSRTSLYMPNLPLYNYQGAPEPPMIGFTSTSLTALSGGGAMSCRGLQPEWLSIPAIIANSLLEWNEANPGDRNYLNTSEVTNWTQVNIDVVYSQYGVDGVTSKNMYQLVGTVTPELTLIDEEAETIIDVLSLELSGWGYVPSGGFSFRKTHTRHSSTSCPIPGSGLFVTNLPEELNISFPDFDINSDTVPPYKWEYPAAIPLPANYWLTQKGSASPLYPTFIKSLIYDIQLEKWGIANMAFKAICAIAPVNRADDTIAPKHDYGMLAAILNPDGSISTILPKNTESEICYGKIGQYRLGKSTLSYLKCHFKEPFTGSIIVETSKDGRTVAIELTKAADFTNVKSAKFPFTLVGDWFNIKVRGDFTLSHIECYIEGRSRR